MHKLFLESISSRHTRRAYRRDLVLFESMARLSFAEATQETVRSFLSDLRDRGESVSTIRRRLSALRSFYEWMREEGHREQNPAREVQVSAAMSSHSTSPLDADALQQLMSSVAGDTKRAVRAAALIRVILYGALRRGPLARLNVDDVRPLGRRWVIDLQSHDGRGGYIPIPSSAVEAVERVKEHFSIDHGPLWRSLSNRSRGERLSPDALYKIVRRAGREADLEAPVTIGRLRTAGLNVAMAAGAHPEDVRMHSRLRDSRSLASHLSGSSEAAGLRPDVPARIEEALSDAE